MPDATTPPEDLRGFDVEAADGPFGVVSESGEHHITLRIRRGLGRHDEIVVPRIVIAGVDRENRRVTLGASRGEIEDLRGGEAEPGKGLGAWFGGTSATPQQPFPPTLPGPAGAPEDERPA